MWEFPRSSHLRTEEKSSKSSIHPRQIRSLDRLAHDLVAVHQRLTVLGACEIRGVNADGGEVLTDLGVLHGVEHGLFQHLYGWRVGSFTRAAGKLGLSQSALSHTISRLEARLGVRLLNRTTRSVAPTEAGTRLLETLRPSFQNIRATLGTLSTHSDKPAGTIRITSADHVAETIVWPVLRRLLPQFPDIKIELNVENGFVNIVEERYDVGIRLGNNVERDMIAVAIGPQERPIVVASQSYLALYPAPATPSDLANHQCINRRMATLGGHASWSFSKGGKQVRRRVDGQISSNRPELILEAAAAGLGCARVLESQAERYLADGRLVSVLDDWCPYIPGYHLYYPSRHQNSHALQVLIAALRYRA